MEAGSGAVGHAALQSPPLQGGRIRSCRTHDAPERSLARRRDPEPRYTWRSIALPYRETGSGAVGHVAHRSPPLQGGRIQSCRTRDAPEPNLAGRRVQSHGTRGCARALPIREARSGATGHVAAPEPTSAGRQGPVL
jgi:hypothetical protein